MSPAQGWKCWEKGLFLCDRAEPNSETCPCIGQWRYRQGKQRATLACDWLDAETKSSFFFFFFSLEPAEELVGWVISQLYFLPAPPCCRHHLKLWHLHTSFPPHQGTLIASKSHRILSSLVLQTLGACHQDMSSVCFLWCFHVCVCLPTETELPKGTDHASSSLQPL